MPKRPPLSAVAENRPEADSATGGRSDDASAGVVRDGFAILLEEGATLRPWQDVQHRLGRTT